MAERKYIGAGWKKKTDKGSYVALSFKADELAQIDLANCWVSLVVNDRKSKPTHPDFNITASPKSDQAPAPKPKQNDDPFDF